MEESPRNKSAITALGLVLVTKDYFLQQCRNIMANLFSPEKSNLSIGYELIDKPLEPYAALYSNVQDLLKNYIASYMLMHMSEDLGLEEFVTRQRIGDASEYGVINLGDYGTLNNMCIVKTDVGGINLFTELYMGLLVFNSLRQHGPYWVYTYGGFTCNSSLQHPQGSTSYWCKHKTDNLQLIQERINGETYSAFLVNKKEHVHRQMVVLARIMDAVGFMWTRQVTHGDLHSNNILIVTLQQPVYTQLLMGSDDNPQYIFGQDIPVIIDYGFSNNVSHGVLHSTFFDSREVYHNPFRDLRKLFDCILQYGGMLKSANVYNDFGTFAVLVEKELMTRNSKDLVISSTVPFISFNIPQSILRTHVQQNVPVYGLGRKMPDTFTLAMLKRRTALTSPIEVINALKYTTYLEPGLKDQVTLMIRTFHLTELLVRWHTAGTNAKDLTEKMQMLLSEAESATTRDESSRVKFYARITSEVFSAMQRLYVLVTTMVTLHQMIRLPIILVTQRDIELLDALTRTWSVAELNNLYLYIMELVRIWQGMNNMVPSSNKHSSVYQRPVSSDDMRLIGTRIAQLEQLLNSQTTSISPSLSVSSGRGSVSPTWTYTDYPYQ